MIEESKLRVKWRFSPGGGITLVVLLFTSGIAAAQNLLINPSFELPGISKKITDWTKIKGWRCRNDGSSGIEKKEFYSPVEGKWYAFQKGGGDYIQQETNHIIAPGETYSLKLWARSINGAGNDAMTTIEASFYCGTAMIVTTTVNLNAPQLKGAAARFPNDDGANVWIDGKYRHEFADYHMYQSIDFDPISDPWLLVETSGYEEMAHSLGWAVGPVIAGSQKFIYGTIYHEMPGDLFSSIRMMKVLSTNGPDYAFSEPVTILSHSGSEFPWVEDPYCFYDDSTGRLWMAWGGGTCYVSELDPTDGMLVNHPPNPEFDTHPKHIHVPVATWPETRPGWCGDEWSRCWMEGPALYKHDGYWYLFGSYGNLSRDYTIRCGRGTSPTGPFYDKDGVNMMKFDPKRNEYGNTILLGTEGEQLVPGHPHIWEEKGKYYLGYDFRKSFHEEKDYMGIRRLYWVNDWPTIWIPVSLTFNANDHPEVIGKKLGIAFRNIGEAESVMAVDMVTVNVSRMN